MMYAYLLLGLCVISEVFAASMLKISDGFRSLPPTIGVFIGYGIAFYVLSLSIKTIPIGVAYAIWGGLATALTALIGIIIYKESFNSKTVMGFLLIIGGVILLM